MRTSILLASLLALVLVLPLAGCGGSDENTPPVDTRPRLTAVAPERGPQAGGTILTLTGRNFRTGAGATSVTIGGAAAADVIVDSAMSLTCRTPSGVEGAVDVVVATSSGSSTLDDAFAYNPLPRITAVDPATGWTTETTTLTVRGAGFQAYDPGPNALRIGGIPATNLAVVDDEALTATCPAVAPGLFDVEVENENGLATMPDAFACFEYPLVFPADGTRLDGATPVPIVVGSSPGVFGTEPDGRSANAAVAAAGSRVYVAWQEMRNGVADIHFNRSFDGGVTWLASDVRVNHGTVGADSAGEVALVCDGLDVFAVWTDYRSGAKHVYFNASSDGGTTWENDDLQLSTSGGASIPYLVEDGGTIHVVWRQGNTDVVYRRSADGGETWGDPVRLDDYSGQSDRPRLFVAAGRVHAAWTDGTGVYYNESGDGGLAWGAPERVDQAPADFCGYVELCAGADYAFLTWQDFRDDFGDVYFRRKDLLTHAWGDETRLDTDGPGTSDAGTPKVGCRGTVVYVVWFDYRVGPGADVLFRRSPDAGSSWSTVETRISTNGAGEAGKLDLRFAWDHANLYVAWTDVRNAPTSHADIYFTSSRDGGTTWLAEDVRLNAGSTGASATMPALACDGAHVYVAWQDSRPGLSTDLDIYATASQP